MASAVPESVAKSFSLFARCRRGWQRLQRAKSKGSASSLGTAEAMP
jgi:hypothetical protein